MIHPILVWLLIIVAFIAGWSLRGRILDPQRVDYDPIGDVELLAAEMTKAHDTGEEEGYNRCIREYGLEGVEPKTASLPVERRQSPEFVRDETAELEYLAQKHQAPQLSKPRLLLNLNTPEKSNEIKLF